MRNLPSLPSKITSLRASSSGITPQGASVSSKPVDEGALQHVASKAGRLHLTKTKLSGSAGGSLQKLEIAKVVMGTYSKPGYVALPRPREYPF